MTRQAQDFLGRRWRELCVTTLVILVGAILVLQMLPSRFTARADVLLDPRHDKAFGPDDIAATINLDTASVESAVALIKGNAVLLRVVRAEKLADDPEFNGAHASPGLISRWVSVVLGRHPPLPSSTERYAVGALFRALRIDRVGKAYVLSISATAREPEKAARLANAVADGFVQDQRDARLEAARREAVFFADRLAPLGEQLRRSEDALDRFRREHDLTATANAGQGSNRPTTLNEQQLADLNGKLAQVRTETAEAWAHYDEARSTVGRGGGMEALPDVLRSTVVAQLRQQQAEVARKEADLAARYSESYPSLINARAERREIERAITREMARVAARQSGCEQRVNQDERGFGLVT